MPRWDPHAKERLEVAALHLYASRGYDETTVGDIARSAGVTSRTYFRYFPDKREVLFGGADRLRERITDSLNGAGQEMAPLDATVQALKSCSDLFRLRDRASLRNRNSVIDGSAELQEREAHKLASLASVVTGLLIERGTTPDGARVVADLAMVVFVRASRLWMDDPRTPFATLVDRATEDVRAALDG